MLEKMGSFFDDRLDGYEAHQLNEIAYAKAFYPATAAMLPVFPGCRVLDLGCGTGLELDEYFTLCPDACVTGIDLATGMLEKLRKKHANKALTLINASYFDLDFGEKLYDAAVSVESLHHFTKEQKTGLYRRLRAALRDGGYFILTDYLLESEEEEVLHFKEFERLKREQNIDDGIFYHYDTPLTVKHETEALHEAGFCTVTVLNQWANTRMLRADC